MILVMHNLRKRKNEGLRTFVISLMLISFCAPTPATAVTLGQLRRNSGFRAMVIAIANLNTAMQQATINPQDKNRREKVAAAYSMMPLAITALAKEFKNNKLHDNDFQYVQGILGGFVQKDLTSKVEDFMKDPSRQNIPTVGSEFPQDAMKQAEDSYIVANREKSLLSGLNENEASKSNEASKTPSDVVDLSSGVAPIKASSQEANSKPQANETIVANRNKSLLNSTEDSNKETSQSQKNESFKNEISKDIQDAEASLTTSVVRAPASSQEDKDKEKEDNSFFKFKEKKKNQIKERKIRKGFNNRTSFYNTYHRKKLLAYAWEVLFPIAAAQGATKAPGQGCEGGGKECSEGGGGGGGGGGGAGEILFGLAAMIAAAAPMVAAAVQANADQQIAKINANTAITNANTQAALQRYSIDQQTGLAKFQAEATQQIADQKNQKEMAQLKLQLDELAASRQQQADLEREKRATEQANLDQELALKEQQALQTIQLAQQQRLSQEVAQGLSTGLQNVRDNGGRLEINQVALAAGGIGTSANLQSRSTAVAGTGKTSAGVSTATSNALANNVGNTASGNQVVNAATSTTAGTSNGAKSGSVLGSAFNTARGAIGAPNTIAATGRQFSTKTVNTLLASATQPSNLGAASSRNIASVGNADFRAPLRGLAQMGQGSSRGFKQKLPVAQTKEKQNWAIENKYLMANVPESLTNQIPPSESQHTQGAHRRSFLFQSREARSTTVDYQK